MNCCVCAAALFNILISNWVSARSLVVIDVDALRTQLDQTHAHAHQSRRADADAEDLAAQEFRPADYLRTALNILYSYKDDDLEDTVLSLTQELKQLNYDNGLYDVIVNKLSELQKKSGSEIKEQIQDITQVLDNDIFKAVSLKLRSVNEVHAVSELMNILRVLDTFRYKSKKRSYDVVDAIKSSLRSAVNYLLGPERTTPAPEPRTRRPRDEFSVSPRTMRAMVEAVNFAFKWLNILSEEKKEENLYKILRNHEFPKREKDILKQRLPDLNL